MRLLVSRILGGALTQAAAMRGCTTSPTYTPISTQSAPRGLPIRLKADRPLDVGGLAGVGQGNGVVLLWRKVVDLHWSFEMLSCGYAL